jgi:uncharacterized membrane protein
MIPLAEDTLINKITTALHNTEYFLDLILVSGWLFLCLIVFYLPFLDSTVVNYVLTIPLVLVIPGYCLIAVLFPKGSDISLLERIALSIGLSIVIIPLIGLGLNFTPWGIRREPVMVSLILFSLVMVSVAFFRRVILPRNERFSMPFSRIRPALFKAFLSKGNTRADQLLNVVIILGIIIVTLTTINVIVNPREGEHFSEFYILGENRTAADYPDQILVGQSYPLYIGIVNHEYRNTTYTVETWMTREEYNTTTNTSSVLAMDPLDRLSLTLSHNETIEIPYNMSAKKTGYNRVEFLLFNESVPGPLVNDSNRFNATYRDLALWITVR